MRTCFLIFLILFSFFLYAQDLPPSVAQQLEELAESREVTELEDDALLQHLQYLASHPLDLNQANFDDLKSLYFLNDLQIHHLLRYRDLLGKFIHVYELQAIPYFDITTIKKMLSFIKLGSAEPMPRRFFSRLSKGQHQAVIRLSSILEKAKGYDNAVSSPFQGDKNHLFFRYRYQFSNKLYFGAVAEKDPGEQFFEGSQSQGFDFYSFHFFARDLGNIQSLALGDFVVNLGQGLTHWQSMAFGKGMQVVNGKRQSPVLLPYRSAGEFNFLRGAGATIEVKNHLLTLFISRKSVDASLDDSSETFSGFRTSGLHRTISETGSKNALGLTTAGGNFQFISRKFKLGVNAVHYSFSKELEKRSMPYNRYAPSGSSHSYFSLDYDATIKNIHVFGEVAADKNLNIAMTSGFFISLDPKVDLFVLFRKISAGYYSLFGNAFTENTHPTNESGLFAGISIQPNKYIRINASADHFHFPWLKYRVDAPSRGSEYLLAMEYNPSRTSSMYVLLRTKSNSLNGREAHFDFPKEQHRSVLRLHLSKQLNREVSVRARAEWVRYRLDFNKEEGFMYFIETVIKKFKWQSSVRFQLFDTESYNSRIYTYENDVIYSNSMMNAYDKGLKYYMNFKYGINKYLDIWTRLGRLIYSDKEEVGSGDNLIQGNTKTDFRIQLVMNFG